MSPCVLVGVCTPQSSWVRAHFRIGRPHVMLEVMQVVQVLIVDDQVSFRRAAREVVELTPGFAVIGEADSGEASVDAARMLRPHLVLMDVHLRGIDGMEATRRIRGAAQVAAPIVFLLSTYESALYSDALAECGAAAYLAKGEFGPARLTAAWVSANTSE